MGVPNETVASRVDFKTTSSAIIRAKTENVAPFVARDGNANMRRLTMFLSIHHIACLNTMSLLCKK